MRVSISLIGGAALAVALIGCSSTPAGPTLAPGQTATPAPATVAPGATATPGGAVLTGHECDAIPTFSVANPDPASPPPDTALESHFPATIDGQPVTDVNSSQWIYFLCAFGGQAALEEMAGEASGFNFATSSYGSAKATVDGEEIELSALRTPGQDANALVQYLSLLAAQSGGSLINPGNVQSTNIGGKNVFTWTDEDGTKSYAYPSGDTLIFFDGATDSQTTKILSALP